MTAVNKGTVQVSKQERILYGEPWAALVRRLGDAAQAMEDARSIADLAGSDSAKADAATILRGGDGCRSAETIRCEGIYNRVATVERGVAGLFREMAAECVVDRNAWNEREPAPSMLVTEVSGIGVLSASTTSSPT